MADVSDHVSPEPMTRRARREAGLHTGPIPLPQMSRDTPHTLVTVVVLAGATLLALSGYAGSGLIALTVLLGGAIIAWGWPGLLGLPSPRGTMTVLLIGTLAMVASATFVRDEPYLRWLPAALALSMLASFVHQIARRDGRPRLVESVASTVMALALIACGVCVIPLPLVLGGPQAVAAGAAAIGASALTDLLARWEKLRHWLLPLAMAGGAAASVAFGLGSGSMSWGTAALLGLLAAAASHSVRRLLGHQPAMVGARSQLLSAAASLLTPGVLIYVVARLFVGVG